MLDESVLISPSDFECWTPIVVPAGSAGQKSVAPSVLDCMETGGSKEGRKGSKTLLWVRNRQFEPVNCALTVLWPSVSLRVGEHVRETHTERNRNFMIAHSDISIDNNAVEAEINQVLLIRNTDI